MKLIEAWMSLHGLHTFDMMASQEKGTSYKMADLLLTLIHATASKQIWTMVLCIAYVNRNSNSDKLIGLCEISMNKKRYILKQN